MRTLLLAVVFVACGLPQPTSPPPAPESAPLRVEPSGVVQAIPLVKSDQALRPSQPVTGDPAAPPGPLPAHVLPVSSRLDLTVDPRTEVFSGEVRHAVVLSSSVDHIWLHGQGLDVRSAVLLPDDGDPIAGTWTSAADPGVARIDLERAAPAGRAVLVVSYRAAFDTQLSGLFKVVEQGDAFALAKSESIQARKYVPGWDEPRYKVPWSISLAIPDGMVAISNGPVVDRRPATGDLVRWTFAETPPLPTYLLSLAVGPFEVVSGPSLPATRDRPRVPVTGYARRGRGAQLERILRLTGPMVDFFEDALGQPYPYRKLDIVAAPAWPSGATELAAAITYRESRILLDDTAGAEAVRSMESVHAHEIAHMWFGNEVTPPWWDDLWLKEGLATWGSTITREALQPEAGHGLDALGETLDIMSQDVLPSTRAVREPIAGNADIRNAYDGVTYRKGRAVIHMLDAWLGPEVFRPALGRYVAARSGGTADAPAFHAELAAALERDEVLAVLQSFVEQPGVPLLEVEVDCSRGVVARVAQSPQGALGVPPPDPKTWTVPVCLRPMGGEVACAVMEGPALEVPLDGPCPTWVHPNPGGSAYARIGLSPAAWTAAASDLAALPTEDALPLVASALAALDAGTRSVAEVLPLLDAAATHPDRRVALLSLRAAEGWLELPLSPGSQEALQLWLGAHARERIVGARRQPGDDARLFETALLEILVESLDDKLMTLEMVDRAQSRVGYRGAVQTAALDSDRLTLGLTAAVRLLGRDFADFLQEELATLDDPRLQPAVVAALAGARDPGLAAGLRATVLDGQLDPRDAWSLVVGLLAEEETRPATQKWVLANLDALVTVIPSQWRRRVPTLALAGCDAVFLAALRARNVAAPRLLPGSARPFRQVEEQVNRCTVVRDARAPEVEAAFSSVASP